jgi:hypothetical protein
MMKITNLLDTTAAHIASAAPAAVRFFGVVVLLSSLSSLAYAQEDRGPKDFQGGHVAKKQLQGGTGAAGVGTEVGDDSGGEGADSGDDNSDDVNDPGDGPSGNDPNSQSQGNANGANSGHHCVPPHNVGCKPAVPQ